MIDVLVLIFLGIGIFLIRKGIHEKDKKIKYIGYIVIALCSIYIIPQFIRGFLDGIMAPF